MRNILTVLIAIALIATFAMAQGITVTGYGPKAQLNLANISGDNSDNNKIAVMFGVGGFLNVNIIPELDVQGEVLYNQKGCKVDVPGGETTTLAYLDVDVLAKYNIPMEGDIKPVIFAGPQIGFLLSASYGDQDIKDNLESLDYGLIFGAGVSIPAGDGSVLVDARYNLGLANMNKVGGSIYSNQNQVISISVGYAFK